MNRESQIAALLAGALAPALLLLWLLFSLTQLHYSGLQLRTELKSLCQEPLLQKTLSEVSSEPDLESLRALAEKSGLYPLNSQTNENTIEIIWQGGYKNFLEYLCALGTEISSEITQLELSGGAGELIGKIVLKPEGRK